MAKNTATIYRRELVAERQTTAALRAEVARLRAELAMTEQKWEDEIVECGNACDRLMVLNARLREAIKPFAECASIWKGEPDALIIELLAYDEGHAPSLSVADFRLAAEALEQSPPKGETP